MTVPLFGIHLGNSSGCVGIFKDGKADVLANDSGERMTPAVVSYRNNEKVVGIAAKAALARFSACTVTGNKRLMNVSISDKEVADAVKHSSCKILQDDDGLKYSVDWEGMVSYLTPDQIHTQLYKKLYETATSSLHSVETTLPAVLTVPARFCSASRTEIARCAEEAGFKVLQLIDEASAALLAHNVGQEDLKEEGYVVVYRVGGASLDVTVFYLNSGMYTLVNTIHEHNVGGNCVTEALASFLAEDFRKKYQLDPRENRRSMAKLRAASETCKHVLSTMNSALCFAESLVDGVDLSVNVSRARLESILNPLLPKFLDPVIKALDDASITKDSVKKVVVSGGSMKIPRFQQALSALLPSAEVLGLSPAISPDEVVAIGAALQASYLPSDWPGDVTQLSEDVPALLHTVSIQCDGDKKAEEVAAAGCPVPCRRVFVRTVPLDCKQFTVRITQDGQPSEEVDLDVITPGSTIDIEVSIAKEGNVSVTMVDQRASMKAKISPQ